MTDGIFNDEPAHQEPQVESQQTPGEDIEVLKKRLMDKDAFIEKLQKENEEAREAALRKMEADAILEEARRKAAEAPKRDDREGTPPAQGSQPSFDVDEVAKRVSELQAKKTAEERSQANLKEAEAKLVEVLGSPDAAKAAVAKRAEELGVGPQFLADAARKSPAAFFQLLELKTTHNQAPAPRGQVNTHALGIASTAKEGTNAYYEKIRKEDPKRYFSSSVQRQRFEDAKRLGAAFWQ